MDPKLRDTLITYPEFSTLAHLRRHLHRLTFALEFSARIGRPVERSDLVKLTQRLLGVKLAPNLVDVIYALCGDAEGRLDGAEMVKLLRHRERMPGRKVGGMGWGGVGAGMLDGLLDGLLLLLVGVGVGVGVVLLLLLVVGGGGGRGGVVCLFMP